MRECIKVLCYLRKFNFRNVKMILCEKIFILIFYFNNNKSWYLCSIFFALGSGLVFYERYFSVVFKRCVCIFRFKGWNGKSYRVIFVYTGKCVIRFSFVSW